MYKQSNKAWLCYWVPECTKKHSLMNKSTTPFPLSQ